MLHGCHNHPPREAWADVQIGWWPDGRRAMKTISSAWANDNTCKYDLSATDRECAGCRWIPVPAPVANVGQSHA